jgi:hypothetical protein
MVRPPQREQSALSSDGSRRELPARYKAGPLVEPVGCESTSERQPDDGLPSATF